MATSKAEVQRRYRMRHKEMIEDMNNLLLRQHQIIMDLLHRLEMDNVVEYLFRFKGENL